METSHGVFEAERYVLALGTSAPVPSRSPLGIRIPVYPLKGYSLSLPVTSDSGAPRISVTDFKRKVVYARLGDELRVAGMADLAGRRAEIDTERVDQLVEEVRNAFPDATDFSRLEPWCGMRPATPKGTPVLGATPYSNLLARRRPRRARLHARHRHRQNTGRPGCGPRTRKSRSTASRLGD